MKDNRFRYCIVEKTSLWRLWDEKLQKFIGPSQRITSTNGALLDAVNILADEVEALRDRANRKSAYPEPKYYAGRTPKRR